MSRVNNRKTRISRLMKEGAWIVVGQGLSLLGALALVRVLTEYLDPVEYGELALGLTIAGLVNQVVMAGVIAGIGRYYSIATEAGDKFGYFQASNRILHLATLAVLGIAVIVTGGLVAFERSHWIPLALLVFLFSILSSYNSVLGGIQNAARQRAVVAIHSGVDAWLKIGLALGVMLLAGSTSLSVVLGYMLSSLLVTLSQVLFVKRLIKKNVDSKSKSDKNTWEKQIWGFAWPFSAWGAFTWTQQISDRWSLEAYSSTADVGKYAVVFQLGYSPIVLLSGLVMMFISPILYERYGSVRDVKRSISAQNIAWRITLVGMILTLFLFLACLYFHELIFSWLVASEFREVSYLLPWMVLAGGLFSIGQFVALKLMSELRSNSLLVVKATTAMIGLAANIIGAHKFGLNGVVGGLLVFAFSYAAWMLVLSSRNRIVEPISSQE